jgi:hypothetical protein
MQLEVKRGWMVVLVAAGLAACGDGSGGATGPADAEETDGSVDPLPDAADADGGEGSADAGDGGVEDDVEVDTRPDPEDAEPDDVVPDAEGSADADAGPEQDTEGSVDVDAEGSGEGDVSDGSGDAAGEDATEGDTGESDSGVDECGYFDADNRLVRCSGEWVYTTRWQSFVDGCEPYYTIATSEEQFTSVEEAVAAKGCETECIWSAATSVSLVRCGVRTGYIIFNALEGACDPVYEYPEGYFASPEEHAAAYPCADRRPEGQCETSDDCPGISICTASAPGGICNGCGSFSDCPADTDECSEFGACRRLCDVDDDCPAGQECGGTGFCLISQCQRGACPDLRFGCNAGGRCERVSCSDGEECPASTECRSGYCME